MNKCQHGQKIAYFCASQNCQYKQSAGCELCIKKYHSHITNTNILNEQSLQNIIKKYVVDTAIKPKCRILQQTIYHYFTTIKNQLNNSLQNLSKNLINQVGYPFLHKHNIMSTYKRVKNKQYRKLGQKEFKVFYQITNKLQQKQFLKQESSIYQKQTKNISELMNSIENFMGSYESISKKFQLGFTHDRSIITGFNDIIRNINSQISINKQSNNVNQSPGKSKNVPQGNKTNGGLDHLAEMVKISMFNNGTTNLSKQIKTNDYSLDKSKQLSKLELKNDSKVSNKSDLKLQLNKLTSNSSSNSTNNNNNSTKDRLANEYTSIQTRLDKQRPPSIDKTILNSQRMNNSNLTDKSKEWNSVLANYSSKETEASRQNGKIEILKLELNSKQLEINEKKKFLLDMMRNKQQKILEPVKPKLQFKQSYGNKEIFAKKDFLMQQYKQQLLNNSSQQDNSIQTSFDNSRHQAFAKLPAEQRKSPERQEAKKKLIVVPVVNDFPQIRQGNSSHLECHSPLYKKKITQSRMTQYKPAEAIKIQKKQPEFQVEFKQNEQKSLALFLKSLNLKAEQAITYLCSSLKYADNNLSAAQYLSYLYLYLNRPKDCLLVCNKILQKYENNTEEQLFIEINNNKSVALNTLGRYSQSIVILEKCIKCKQKDLIFKNLGDAYFSVGMNDKAIYNYQKCLKLNQSFDEAHYNLAVCLYSQQNYNNARYEIIKALQYQPKNEQYLQLQTNIELKSKNTR